MRPQTKLTWDELHLLVSALARQVAPRIFTGVYGVPTGGSVVATMLQAYLSGIRLLDRPEPGCLVVDDICDSGATLLPYKQARYDTAVLHVRPTSVHIPTKAVQITDDWIVYPWEHQEAPGREIVTRMIELIGDDPSREGLLETPERVLKAWREVFYGYHGDRPKLATFTSDADQMVTLAGIDFVSFCEHHILPFWGKAHVGYIPKGKVLGLSKLARLVEHQARKLQIQERLAAEIADAIEAAVEPRGVGVVLEATHMCMVARGVKKDACIMSTAVLRGAMREEVRAREEFYALIGRHA